MNTHPTTTILLLAGSLLLSTCRESPTEPVTGATLSHPTFTIVAFTRARVTDNGSVTRAVNDIDHVGLGFVISAAYSEQVTVHPSVTKVGSSFAVTFDTTVTLPDTLLNATFRTRLYLTTGQTVDADTSVDLFRYPYQSAEVVVPPLQLAYPNGKPQDIAFVGDVMYLLPLGDQSLYRIQPGQQVPQYYKLISESDFLAGDSCYIFIDNGLNLQRFNTTIDTFDLTLRYVGISLLLGVGAENGKVYALYPDLSLIVLDRNGQTLDSTMLPWSVFHITVSNGVLIGHRFGHGQLARFDIQTRTQLPDIQAPAYNIEGLECHAGFLYYADVNRRTIMRVPLLDLTSPTVTVPTTAPHNVRTRGR